MPIDNPILKATHQGELNINGFKISCAVLENGERVLVNRSLANAFGIKGSGAYWKKKKSEKGALLPEYLSAKYLQPFIKDEHKLKLYNSIDYENKAGVETEGVDATFLSDICDIYVKAGKKGAFKKNPEIPENAYNLLLALSKVAIIALVDEATGYQYDREKYELQAILQLFISPDILDWQKTFHLSFYKEIFRLWNIPFTPQNIKRKPPFIGMLTNELIYKNLPKGSFVLQKLKEKTPKTEGGNYKVRLFQSLTPFGKEELKKVFYSVESLAVISENKKQFRRLVQDRYGQRTFQFPNWNEIEDKKEPIKLNDFDQNLKRLLSVPPMPKEKK